MVAILYCVHAVGSVHFTFENGVLHASHAHAHLSLTTLLVHKLGGVVSCLLLGHSLLRVLSLHHRLVELWVHASIAASPMPVPACSSPFQSDPWF